MNLLYNADTVIKVQPKKIYWFLIYPLATLIFAALSVIFILSAKGYSIQFENGNIGFQKTGMIIMGSNPSGADIFLDGKPISKKTASFFSAKINNLSKDKYFLSVEKEGYYKWEKELRVFPEMVTWANYILLFSKEPKIEKAEIQGSLVQSFPSLDRKENLVLTKTPIEEILYKIDNDSGEKTTVLETSKLRGDQKISSINIIDWSKDHRNILVSGILAGENKYWVINADSKKLESLDALSPIKFDKLMFNTGNSDEIYGSLQGAIRKINLKEKKVSDILEKQVIYFTLSSDGTLYYIKDSGKKRVLYRVNGGFSGETEIFDSLPISEAYEVKISDKNQKIALRTKEDSTVYVIEIGRAHV